MGATVAPGSQLALTPLGKKELAKAHPALAAKSFPLPGCTLRLPSSGRVLGYCEHVDSTTPTKRTVVLLPGCPGTRLFTHPSVAAAGGFVPGWRLIVLERPGIGLSDPPPDSYTYVDFVADFREFCAQLGLERVSVIGFSAGTPFATAIACSPAPAEPAAAPGPPYAGAERALSASASAAKPGQQQGQQLQKQPSEAPSQGQRDGAPSGASGSGDTLEPGIKWSAASAATGVGVPTGGAAGGGSGSIGCATSGSGAVVQVERVALVSAIGPPDTPNKRRGMALLFQFAYFACAYLPWLVGWMVRSEAAALRRRPVHAIRQAFAPYSSKADVAALKRPEVEESFLESALEMYARGQEGAVLRENLMFAARPWGFSMMPCRTPVAIWQGGQDKGCTVAMAAHLSEVMGPAAKLTVLPEQGHMLYFEVWEQVVAWVNCLTPA